jgi:hypothetical protein
MDSNKIEPPRAPRKKPQIDADERRFYKRYRLTGMTGRAVRYADMDRQTPEYTNEFAYQGVSQSVRPADAGQRGMRPRQILF